MAATLTTDTGTTTTKGPVDRQEISTRLLRSAAKKSYDPVVDIDWAADIPADLYGLSPEWSTLYGTPLWDEMTDEQRVTLTVHEYCSISGVGIWFEVLLMQLVLRDVYGHDPAKLRASASGLVGYLRGVGLIGGPSERMWKRQAPLIPGFGA